MSEEKELTYAYIRRKLLDLPKKFKEFYNQQKWSYAKSCYDTALTVALFIELPEDEMEVLFGSREKEIKGMFLEEDVQYVFYKTVVKGNEDSADDTYQKYERRQSQRKAAGIYAKK